ncbi:hypothetical protein FRX31_033566 [Thalictrum thalictroides]|nr:hypothetical protein FRX31_033566 [Thalictrum thalictroides]
MIAEVRGISFFKFLYHFFSRSEKQVGDNIETLHRKSALSKAMDGKRKTAVGDKPKKRKKNPQDKEGATA